MPENKYPLYHGMRSKKSPEQIKKEGFCAYDPKSDLQKDIMDALKKFKKEGVLKEEGWQQDTIRMTLRTINDPDRKMTWATARKDAPCGWWAHANPEHISEVLTISGVSSDDIDKYLREKYGDRCYNVKLKLSESWPSKNTNIQMNCVPPELIESIEECKECKYTGKYHGEIPPL